MATEEPLEGCLSTSVTPGSSSSWELGERPGTDLPSEPGREPGLPLPHFGHWPLGVRGHSCCFQPPSLGCFVTAAPGNNTRPVPERPGFHTGEG